MVTVTATNSQGTTATDTDDARVSITPVAPTVQVDKTANPISRPAPGGDFAYTVVVTNTSTSEPLTITLLNDSVYGNLATRGTCTNAIGTVLAVSPGPANTYTCAFTAPFTGDAGASLTDVVTVVGTDDDGQTATDTDDATVTITTAPTTPTTQRVGICIAGSGGSGGNGTGIGGSGAGIGGTATGGSGTGTGGPGGAGGDACNGAGGGPIVGGTGGRPIVGGTGGGPIVGVRSVGGTANICLGGNGGTGGSGTGTGGAGIATSGGTGTGGAGTGTGGAGGAAGDACNTRTGGAQR